MPIRTQVRHLDRQEGREVQPEKWQEGMNKTVELLKLYRCKTKHKGDKNEKKWRTNTTTTWGLWHVLLGTQCWLLGSNEHCFQSTQVCPVPGFGQHPEMILYVLAHCTQARKWVFKMACYSAIRFWWCKNIGILPGASPCLLGGGGWYALCQSRWNVLLHSLSSSPWDVLPT